MLASRNTSSRLPFPVLGLCLALVGACAGSGAPVSTGEAAETQGGEAQPLSAVAAAGKVSYDRACGACHPGGEADLGPAVRGIGWTQDKMQVQIREGSGKMRPIAEGRLPDADLAGLYAYLTAIGALSDAGQP